MSQNGRRRFLTGGMLAAAATTYVGSSSRIANAQNAPTSNDGRSGCVSYAPNEALASAIAKAWSDAAYRMRLLTFPEGDAADWSKVPANDHNGMLARTRHALAEFNVFLDSPVVLTPKQYADYKQLNPDTEVNFVLPSPPASLGNRYSLNTAKVMMAVTCRGM